jgi:succinate dehydrogenase hydrophobic anchor subunit
MKWSYIQMPLLIQGPKQPGNDIDMLLQPVIDELLHMWETGVKDVWDEYKKEQVTIKAILIAIITYLVATQLLKGNLLKANRSKPVSTF